MNIQNFTEYLAYAYNGESIQSGGNVYIAVIPLTDGKVIVFGEDSIGVYQSRDSFDNGDSALSNYYPAFSE